MSEIKDRQIATKPTATVAQGIAWAKKTGADGSFGAATESAVKAFQRSRNIGADGICGIKTWSALLGM